MNTRIRMTVVLALAAVLAPALSGGNEAGIASVEIAGVTVQNGMALEELRAAYPADAIYVVEKAEGVAEDFDIWLVRGKTWEDGGSISFQGGRVWRATRNMRSSSDPDTYAMFALLNEMLLRLTGGRDTCLMVRTGVPQDIFPQSQTGLILPDRIIHLDTAARTEERRSVTIKESTRVNPVPVTEKTQQGLGDTGRCVFVGG